MPFADTDPEVTGAQTEGDTFSGTPVVVGGKDDASQVRSLRLDDSGRLKVIQASVVPPDGATPFSFAVPQADLDYGTTEDSDSAVIAAGKTLFLQLCLTGSELDGSGNRVDLLWVEGAGGNEHLIEQFFVHGPSVEYPLFDASTTQDGTPLDGNGANTFLRVRRIRLSGGNMECSVSIRGYTQ